MLKKPPLTLDTTIISVFGKAGKLDILEKLYSGNLILPTEVKVEASKLLTLNTAIGQALHLGWMEEHTMNYVDHPEQVKIYVELNKRFGSGEAAVMAIARDRGGTVGSDDMRATAKYCKIHGIPLMGSLGILFDAYSKKIIPDISQANSLLSGMIAQGYKSPVTQFENVIEWFERGKGRELF